MRSLASHAAKTRCLAGIGLNVAPGFAFTYAGNFRRHARAEWIRDGGCCWEQCQGWSGVHWTHSRPMRVLDASMPGGHAVDYVAFRRRNELLMTETEEKLIASAAISGDRSCIGQV